MSTPACTRDGPGCAHAIPAWPHSPERLSVVRISVATGTVTAILFRGVDPMSTWSTLTADSSGRYLMLTHTDVSLRPGVTRAAQVIRRTVARARTAWGISATSGGRQAHWPGW
jgi:hypothetical protein